MGSDDPDDASIFFGEGCVHMPHCYIHCVQREHVHYPVSWRGDFMNWSRIRIDHEACSGPITQSQTLYALSPSLWAVRFRLVSGAG